MSENTKRQINGATYDIKSYFKNDKPVLSITIKNGSKSSTVAFQNKAQVWEFIHDTLGAMKVFDTTAEEEAL